MPTYDKNFNTVCNDLVEFSETTETLAFTKRNSLLGYQKSTDTNFIFCPDGSAIDYKSEGIDADGKGDFYVRVEALLPGMIIEIPDVGRVKVLTVQLGKLFTNRLPGHGVNSLQLTNELLNENERDMNIWVVTIDKNLFSNNECCKEIYDYFNTEGSTVDLNGEKMKIQMTKEIFDKMVKDSALSEGELVDMFYNKDTGLCKWTENSLNHNESNVAACTAQQHSDRTNWINFIDNMLNEFTNNQQFKDTAATQTTAGGYSIYGNPLEVFVNNKGYELNYVFSQMMIGAYQVDQILDNFLGKGQMNGTNDIVKKENSNCIFIPGKDVTRMQQSWDNAFGTIWGNLCDAKTMTTGISKLGDNHGDIGFYSYLYNVNKRCRHKGIAQALFDAFTKGRTAINNKDYVTRDIQICIIRRLVSRVVLQVTLDHLNLSISTVTQKGIINNPSPDRLQYVAKAVGLLYACAFTHRDYNYLTIYDKEYNPYVSTAMLLGVKLLKLDGLTTYGLDTSAWDLLSKDDIDTLKFMRMFVSAGLLENDPPLYLDLATNTWTPIPTPCVEYTYFTAEALNNSGKQSTFTVTLPKNPVPDTFISSPDYIETISAYAVPTSVVKSVAQPELTPVNGTGAKDGAALCANFWQLKTNNNTTVWDVKHDSCVAEHLVAEFGTVEREGDAINCTQIFDNVSAATQVTVDAFGYNTMPGFADGLIIPDKTGC